MNGGLINRAEALKAIDKLYLDGEFGIYNDGSEIFAKCHNAISNVPAADAEQVRCGRWEHLGGDEWCCSECGEVIHTEGSWERPSDKYCRECGVRMDREVQNDG